MTVDDMLELKPELECYLKYFDDCFPRPGAKADFEVYVNGQTSSMPRKSVEPIALEAGVDERSLQLFLSSRPWDQELLRDKTQQLVATEHGDPQAIVIIDETGHPKKGDKTPGVKRQYCGNTGKIDNCMVTVHLAYSSWDGEFKTLLDSDLFLPEDWSEDRARCQRAGIPDTVTYRPKWQMALEQLDRAQMNYVKMKWVTADEYYGSKPAFLTGIIDRGLLFVVEVPKNFCGWTSPPLELTPTASKPSTVEDLGKHSPTLTSQQWKRYVIKDTEKGEEIWEVRSRSFGFHDGSRLVPNARFIMARNVRNPEEVKYFVAYAPAETPLTELLHVAFARPAIEECFLRSKDDLGLSHYEGRTYLGLLRHLYISAVTLLFIVRQTLRLRKKKSGGYSLPSPGRYRRRRLLAA